MPREKLTRDGVPDTPPKGGSSMGGHGEFGAPAEVFALGVDMLDGRYFRPPSTTGSFAYHVNGLAVKPGGGKEPRVGVDPNKLEEAGWGVIFADDSAREALRPLLALRRHQAGARYKEYSYVPGQSAQAFLNATGAAPGPADPENAAPYYMTVVGGPQEIPFEFQQELDVRYAVGRLAFDDLDEYASYAGAVEAAETGETVRSRVAAFFGVEHKDDRVTRLCNDLLVEPLAAASARHPMWRSQMVLGKAADRRALSAILEGCERPALLLTASHALVLPSEHELQRQYQGALLTAEWPGPAAPPARIEPDQVFAASDVGEGADIAGMLAILVGCFTTGTPRLDAFETDRKVVLAPEPFVAQLPKTLLARGVLAVVGHVDSLFLHSFAWPGAGDGPQHYTFEAMLYHLMQGNRLGHAMDVFGRRYGELAARLIAARLEQVILPQEETASYWIGYHDARQYAILGDPAVRLAV